MGSFRGPATTSHSAPRPLFAQTSHADVSSCCGPPMTAQRGQPEPEDSDHSASLDKNAPHMIVTDDDSRLAVAYLLQPVVSFALGFVLFPLVDYSSRVSGEGRSADLLDGALAFGFATGIVGGLLA